MELRNFLKKTGSLFLFFLWLFCMWLAANNIAEMENHCPGEYKELCKD